MKRLRHISCTKRHPHLVSLKGTVHLKIEILSTFIHPQAHLSFDISRDVPS